MMKMHDLKKALIFITLALSVIIVTPAVTPVTADSVIAAPYREEMRAGAATETKALNADQQLTTGQRNIVLRARQVCELEWTPVRNVIKWNGAGVFPAGVTVKGLPYGMPREANYVPLRTSFSEFLNEVEDSGSRFYTSRATRTRVAPYYSLDCSAFVSWAWGLESRLMTGALPRVATTIGRDMQKMQVGDALNNRGVHVVLVTDIQYDDEGEMLAVGIMELDPPQAKYTRYGEDGEFPLQTIQRKYLNNGFLIIRCNNRENVVYIHNCAIPLDGDYCDKCISQNVSAPLPPFIDMQQETNHIDAVKFIDQLGVFNNSGQNASSYDFTMTRGMFIAILARYDNANVSIYRRSVFEDVPIEEWYGQAIAWAAGVGLLDAGQNRFEPRRHITNEEMARIMYDYFQWRGSLSSTTSASLFLIDPGIISD